MRLIKLGKLKRRQTKMSDIQKKLEDYLNDSDSTEYFPDEDTKMMDRMMDFIMSLDSENLSEDQVEEIIDIIDEVADDKLDEDVFEDDVDEAFSAKKVKIRPGDRRKRRMEYRRNRAALKLKAKKFRRTTKFKQYKRKRERKKRQGKTSTGKRIRKFL
jgi:hypothetical protein